MYTNDQIPLVCEMLDECDAFIACAAWCTHPSVLAAMCGKNIGTVINNTSYGNASYEEYLAGKYAASSFKSSTPNGNFVFRGFDAGDLLADWQRPLPPLGQVRRAGDPHTFGGKERVRMMHSKYIVFGRVERISRYFSTSLGEWNPRYTETNGDLEAFVPYAAIVGSCNFTTASTENDECCVLVEGHQAVCQLLEQWFELYMMRSTEFKPKTLAWQGPDSLTRI